MLPDILVAIELVLAYFQTILHVYRSEAVSLVDSNFPITSISQRRLTYQILNDLGQRRTI